jgi:hypothetical protein
MYILEQNLSVLPLLLSIHEILLIKTQKAVAYHSTKRTLCLITVSSRTSYPLTVLGNEVQSLKSYNPLSFKLLSRVLKPCLLPSPRLRSCGLGRLIMWVNRLTKVNCFCLSKIILFWIKKLN